MTNHLFQWTEFALGHGARLLTILLIALLLIRVLRILTRRLIAAASNESATRVARMRERQTRTLAGIIYSAGTAIVAPDQPLDEALNALEAVATDFRADPSWSPMLLDGPRVLGVESLAFSGTTVRLQVRTAPTRQDDVARELRRRIQIELAGRGIQLGGLQRMQLVGTEREVRRVASE